MGQLKTTVCGLVVTMLACALACLAAASTALAMDLTWSGEGSTTENTWSNVSNWVGGVAPSSGSSLGTLTFPRLNSANCGTAIELPLVACYESHNDLTNLSVNQLQLVDGVEVLSEPIRVPRFYRITGNGITLGSGGLTAAPAAEAIQGLVYLGLPITLGASQTWSLDGGNVTAAGLSGTTSELTVDLSDGGLYLEGDTEVGNVTVEAGNNESGSINFLGEPTHVYQLNATDGHSLTLNGVDLAETYTALGALVSEGSTVNVGWPFQPNPGTLATTSASFDATSDLGFEIASPGTTVGTDYAQLTSTGPVELGGATGELYETLRSGECESLPVGQQYTLISTTGSLSGAFGNAPDGSVIHDGAYCNNTYRINYHETGPTQTVTATVVTTSNGSTPGNTEPPEITGTPAVGDTLTTTVGAWSGDTPMDYSYEWLRDGVPIPETDSYTYVVTTADQGHELSVRVTATNKNGSGSATSAAVTIPSSSQPEEKHQEPPGGGSTGGGNPTGGGSTGTTQNSGSSLSTGTTAVTPIASISSAQIAASFAQQLLPQGKLPKLAALLKSGGVSIPFKALEAGTAVIGWYEVPAGVKLAKKTKPRPVLVASGQKSFTGPNSGTISVRLTAAGKKLLKHTKRLKLTAKGIFSPSSGAAVNAVKRFSITG